MPAEKNKKRKKAKSSPLRHSHKLWTGCAWRCELQKWRVHKVLSIFLVKILLQRSFTRCAWKK
jgi:hypothetical protein